MQPSCGGIDADLGLTGAGNLELGQAQDRPSQTWRTFLRNHAEAIAAIDLCVVPTLTFERLFAFVVLGHAST